MRSLIAVLMLASTGLVAACGASIQAVYEGDVRFEHCMALDTRSDVKSTIRSACWEEWVKFYTFGQTRDRVEYAKLRQKQLKGAGDFSEQEWAPAEDTAQQPGRAVPEPTTALEPPPMKLVADAGATEAPDASADAAPAAEAQPPPGAECALECDEAWAACRPACTTAACEKGCTAKYKRCMRRCY